ncbi:MAG: aminotransferase class I/II-fold pyridoxal phosphate-dependent enzyme [Candidatus Coatesbacteria bacterium]|nr:aminotransferase class I/II-fold pyridoxal phosphate-dependent enzyme [Candidatus Coatesbacteria bacterium]
MDIFQKCFAFDRAMIAKKEGYYPYFSPISFNKHGRSIIGNREVIMIGSNNYLGLTDNLRVIAVAKDAIDVYGSSCSGSRFLNGNLDLHLELEEKLAKFMNKEAALVFSTGYQTNLGTISALVGRNDIVIIDKDAHASIVDGCRLSFGDLKRYKHNDLDDLRRVMQSCEEDKGKLVVTDGVFSMGGDLAPLPEIVKICKEYSARLMVDDAHSIGVMGKNGRGTAEHFDVENDVDIIMCTFSKSFAGLGGFIVGSKQVVEYIQHVSRPLIFSASMPPAVVATVLKTLEIIINEPERREKLWNISNFMLDGFKSLGFNTGNSVTPIIPIEIGEDMDCFYFWHDLYKAGVFANAVISPAVQQGQAMIRTSYMATHEKSDMEKVLEIFADIGKKKGIIH